MTSGAPTPAELFAEFRRQVRLTDHDVDPTLVSERDGLVRRSYPEDPAADGAMIESPEGLGASDGEIARSIAAQVAFFRGRGQRVEWKTYADDEPADLVARLVEAGFVAEDEEVVLLGRAADLTSGATAPAGIRVREFSSPLDWERVRTLKDSVWGAEHTWVIDAMREEQAREPALLRSVLAEEVDGECRVVSSREAVTSPACGVARRWCPIADTVSIGHSRPTVLVLRSRPALPTCGSTPRRTVARFSRDWGCTP